MAAYAHENVTVAGTAIGFTEALIARANSEFGRNVSKVICTVETNPIRFTVDGTTPTSSVGHLLNVGDMVYVDGVDVRKFRAIRTGSSGALQCTFEV